MQQFWELIDRDERNYRPRFRYAQSIALSIGALVTTTGFSIIFDVRLPYLFCIGAIMIAAFRGGLLEALICTLVSLGGTAVLARVDDPTVTLRNTAVVAVFCLAMSAAAEALIRSRLQERLVSKRAARREQTLQIMFRESPAITILIDPDGRIAAANNAATKLLSVTDRSVVGLSVVEWFDGLPLPAGSGRLAPTVGGRPSNLDLSFAELPIGGRAYRLLYVRDETEAAAAAERLALTQRELHRIARATSLGQLGSSIAHELNQPLSFAVNYAGVARSMLDAPVLDKDAIKDVVDQSLAQIFRTAAMLKRLRAFVGRRPPKLEWLRVEVIIAEARGIADLAIKEARADFAIEIEEPRCLILVDAVLIQQVILNLITNAADAVRGSGRPCVLLRTQRTGEEELSFTIDDNGAGISEEVRADPFAPFQSTKDDGVGIGLAICKTIVESHGGSIVSISPGALGGASFRFTLACKT